MARSNICIEGARVNNLRNISLQIPRNSLCVITGLSGSGKSSLAFDTLYAEGQRRYLETLSSYARQYLGTLQRPDVDYISGLSPIIAIEQKTTARNPRSTVGTITEIYDFLRLLYARASVAYSPATGKPMIRYSAEQMVSLIGEQFSGKKCILLAPIVKGRKGHYKELFEQILKKGFLQVRIDGELTDITHNMVLDRYKNHFIEIVIDKLIPPDGTGEGDKSGISRLRESINTALYHGKDTFSVLETETGNISHYSKHLMCPESGLSLPEPAPFTFSFNSPLGACPKCKGLGYVTRIDLNKIIPDPTLSVAQGGLAPFGKLRENQIFRLLEGVARKFGFSLHSPIEEIPEEAMDVLLYGSESLVYVTSSAGSTYAVTFPGLINSMEQSDEDTQDSMTSKEQYLEEVECPLCHGTRLKESSLYFRVDGKHIAHLCTMDIQALSDWFEGLETRLSSRQNLIAGDILKEIRDRLRFLTDVGLSYLSLGRATRTLSGGESQRIRLATQIGSALVNVLYILDEPSIGLHQRDNRRLIKALEKLRDSGNSVIVVEHDEETIRSADWLVDLGPGAGRKGGELLYSGPIKEFLEKPSKSLTWQYLTGKKKIPVPAERRKGNGKVLTICGATGNNLKDINVSFPLGCFICITGVSGSGKSTLINETLLPILSHKCYHTKKQPLPFRSISGISYIDKVIEVDQSPIGKTPRSNPATYTNVFADIRKLFETSADAKTRGFKASRFSFNVKGGRCEECRGAGLQTIEMNFLPNVHVPCPVCQGKRYKSDTLAVRYKGKNIYEVLDMTINQAVEFFEHVPSILQKIKTLQEVGLGYVKLGQPSTTLSGGECQRVKLAGELSRHSTGKTFYILDEPTTGLHFEDVNVLLGILHRLADKGNTVVVIEHHPDIIKSSDYVIDLGPEGGKDGGNVVGYGTPEELAKNLHSYTGQLLNEWLNHQQ